MLPKRNPLIDLKKNKPHKIIHKKYESIVFIRKPNILERKKKYNIKLDLYYLKKTHKPYFAKFTSSQNHSIKSIFHSMNPVMSNLILNTIL